jgi:hypothetical protein
MKLLDVIFRRKTAEPAIPLRDLKRTAELAGAALITQQLRELSALVITLAQQQNDERKSRIDLEHALHCVMFAMGRQHGAYTDWFRHDFLKTAELHWPIEKADTPQIVTTLLMQYEAGALHRKNGVD